MKKILLLGCVIGIAMSVNSQTYITKVHPSVDKPVLRSKNVISGYETNSNMSAKQKASSKISNPIPAGTFKKAPTEAIIGQTTYDLQSNSSVQNRIKNHGDGTISAIWTYSESYDAAAADRGTGYNFFNGTSWGSIPTSRIEPEKTGWPNIATTSTGNEVFLCHNIAQSKLTMGISPIGSGSWTLSNITNDDQIWNRMAIGGSNGQTIHHISLRCPVANGGIVHKGVDGHLLYFRSLDGGITWDKQDQVITGIDSSKFKSMSGDSYSMAETRGDTVAFVYFGEFGDVLLAKSTDNGDNWTITVVNDFPLDKYDMDGTDISDVNDDGIADTIETSDGAGAVLLDQNGMAHIFYGLMRVLDDTPGDGSYSYFPGTNGVMYWNESFGSDPPIWIAGALDIDGSGILLDNYPTVDIALYFVSMSGFPSAGIDANGCIYLSYSAIMETLDINGQFYRHVYITKSCDGGCSWTTPVDVTPDNDYAECVFASMACDVDNNIHLVYQRDLEPGLAVRGDEDPFTMNEIVYLEVPVTDFDAVPIWYCYTSLKGDSLFCIGDSVLLTASCGTAYSWSNGATTPSTYYSGAFGTVTVDITTPCGVITESISVSAPSDPPIVSLSATTTEMCDGDTSWITATSNAGGTYSWSTGETTQTIAVDLIGTYSVTVFNCGGVTVESITISPYSSPPSFSLSATDYVICNGDSTWITINTVSQASYVWSTGDSTKTIKVDSAGTYSVSVTNCGGTSEDSITISLPSLPVASVSGNTTFCTGGSTTLTAGTVPSATYIWSTGDTAQSIDADTIGTYYLYVMNCAGADTTNITVSNTPPPTVTVTIMGNTEFCDGLETTGLIATGAGTGGSYLWSNGETINTLSLNDVSHSGNYWVIAYNVCGDSDTSSTTTITINPLPSIDSASVTDVTVNAGSDGAIDITVTGGTPPFTYTWSGPNSYTSTLEDISSLVAGTYAVIVVDSKSCTDIFNNIVVDQPPVVGISEVNPGSTFSIHPNPNNGQFFVEFGIVYNDDYLIEVRNVIGQLIYSQKFDNISRGLIKQIDLSKPGKGVYFLSVGNSSGTRTEKLIIY
ncbi:MAG: T9SS type A sorting domain-containing protein [Bacteroidota bacterium]